MTAQIETQLPVGAAHPTLKQKVGEFKYPSKYHNLLIKAGLIGSGTKIILGSHGDKKKLVLDEETNAWVESEEYEVDFRQAKTIGCPALTADGRIVGDWTVSLTKEEVDIVNKECGITRFEENTPIPIFSGRNYDLSDPRDMAEYRVLLETGIVSMSRDAMAGGQRFYVFCPIEEAKAKEAGRQLKRTAIRLEASLSLSEKLEILQIANFKYKLGFPYEMSDDQVRTIFANMAYDGAFKRLITVSEMKDKAIYMLLYRAVQVNVLHIESDDSISKPNGKLMASDQAAFIDMLKQNEGMRRELEHQISAITNRKQAKTTASQRATDLGIVQTYNTQINSEAEVAYWNVQACQQYVKERGWTPTITAADGAHKWRQLALDIYQGNPSRWGSKVAPEALAESGSMEKIKEAYNDTTSLVLTGEKESLIKRIDTWQRDRCINFLKANATLVGELNFSHELRPQHGAAKWRDTTKLFVEGLTEAQVLEIFNKTK